MLGFVRACNAAGDPMEGATGAAGVTGKVLPGLGLGGVTQPAIGTKLKAACKVKEAAFTSTEATVLKMVEVDVRVSAATALIDVTPPLSTKVFASKL